MCNIRIGESITGRITSIQSTCTHIYIIFFFFFTHYQVASFARVYIIYIQHLADSLFHIAIKIKKNITKLFRETRFFNVFHWIFKFIKLPSKKKIFARGKSVFGIISFTGVIFYVTTHSVGFFFLFYDRFFFGDLRNLFR